MDEVVFNELSQNDKYARLRAIDWWEQDKLLSARILVAGAGALGNEVIKNLALLGIGHISIIDYDRIEISNLTRSVLFRETDIGAWKAEVAAARARELNPDIETSGIIGDLELDLGLGAIKNFDLVIGCLDSINARWALNKSCRKVGMPWINGGINATAGEVSFFAPTHPVCYECTITNDMWERFNERQSCTKLAKALPPATIPTTATIASITAGIQVQQCLAYLHSLPFEKSIAPGQKVYISVQPMHFFTVNLVGNPECYAHETMQESILLNSSPHECTVAQLFDLLIQEGLHPLSIDLDFDLMTALECARCGKSSRILPIKKLLPAEAACDRCGIMRLPVLIDEVFPDSELTGLLLSTLGLPSRAILQVKMADFPRYIEFSR